MKPKRIYIHGIWGKSPDVKRKRVDAYPAFEKYGFEFFVHRATHPFSKKDWVITEKSTGTKLEIHWRSMRQAIKGGLEFVESKGESRTKFAIESKRKQLGI